MVRKNNGFTVMEMTVVIGIFAFIIVGLYGTMASGRRVWLIGEALVNEQQKVRITLQRIARELRLSSRSHVHVTSAHTMRFRVPFDADGDGFLDFIPLTSSINYGADDRDDYDSNEETWEANWQIEYQIDITNNRIVRRVLDTSLNVASQRIVAQFNKINSATSYFQTDSGTPIPENVVNLSLATEVDSLQGMQIQPPLKISLQKRVNLRN